jgi:signal transduction histidine kinase
LERSGQAISREIHHLDALCHDWAAWDDTYEFAQASYDDYIEANLVLDTFIINELNIIYIFDIEGNVVWGEIYNLETKEILDMADFPKDALPKTHPLISYETDQSPLSDVTIAGVFMTGQGPMLIASRPVLTSNNEGPIQGSVVFGRFLNDELINTFVEQTRVDFKVFSIQADLLPETIRDIPNRLTPESPYLIEEHDDDHLQIYTSFPDIYDNPALLIMANVPRKISARGSTTIHYAIISLLSAGGIVLVVMLLLLQSTVLSPITRLTTHAVSVGKTGDLSDRLPMQRRDEIGILSREFDRMLGQLSEARKELLEQSYRYGMAEMASGVLHNVRNALHPVIGDIELLREHLRKTPMKEMEMAQRELSEGAPSDERREDLIKFSMLANRGLTTVIQNTEAKLNDTIERIIHIENILDDQQEWAYSKRPDEQIVLEDLVHDTLKFIRDDYREVISVDLDPEISQVSTVAANRISLLQVFANILINAAESIRRKGLKRGEVHIQAGIARRDDKDMIHIRICDNGEGIEADTLEHIFERDFSTKQEGASGLGLHWCANTIASMNGKIYAESEGRGKGACFHLLLPKIYRSERRSE